MMTEAVAPKRPGRLTRLLVNLSGEWACWIRCPAHGFQHDPLLHGYRECGSRYRKCQVAGCRYVVSGL